MPEIDRERMQVLADRFHAEADQCRRMAEGAGSTTMKAEWLRLADEWTRLAQSVGC